MTALRFLPRVGTNLSAHQTGADFRRHRSLSSGGAIFFLIVTLDRRKGDNNASCIAGLRVRHRALIMLLLREYDRPMTRVPPIWHPLPLWEIANTAMSTR